jgi:predicted nuclease of restriction endonuclease-like RecB superfamily
MKKTRNRFEESIRKQIRKNRVVYKYEGETIPYVIAYHYIPDFILYTPLGKVYVECKGYLRPEDRRKMVAVKRLNPKLDIRILFQKLTPTYQRWASRNGFRYAEGVIPDDWFAGL